MPFAGLGGLLAWQLRRLGYPRAGLGLRICGDAAQKSLNRRFRRSNQSTDILSFPAFKTRPRIGANVYLGDLSLSLPYAWAKRGRFLPHFDHEVAFLLLHGILHLIGQHHDNPAQERLMWRKNLRYLPSATLCAKQLRGLGPVR